MEQNTAKVIDSVADQDVDLKGDVLVGRENIHNTLPPHESYEGRHRHDPLAEWTAAEERSVVRKTDLRLLSWLCVMVGLIHESVSFTVLLTILSVLWVAVGQR